MKNDYTYNSPSVKKMLETIKKYMAYSEWKEKYEFEIDKAIKEHEEKKKNKKDNSK